MDDKTEPIEAEELKIDNPVEPIETPQEDNLEQKLKALEQKVAVQAQKLTASKDEALRLKALTEKLEAERVAVKDDSPQLNPSDIEVFKKYAKAAGIPFKEDLNQFSKSQYQDKQQESIDKFLEEYPEYKPENDIDNSKWDSLKQELATYKAPENPKDWYSLMKKSHRLVSPDNSLEKGKALGLAQANIKEQAKIGGSSGTASAPKGKQTPEQMAAREQFEKLRPDIKG